MNGWRERVSSGFEWFRGSRGLWATVLVVVLLAAVWLMPRQISRLVTVDGQGGITARTFDNQLIVLDGSATWDGPGMPCLVQMETGRIEAMDCQQPIATTFCMPTDF